MNISRSVQPPRSLNAEPCGCKGWGSVIRVAPASERGPFIDEDEDGDIGKFFGTAVFERADAELDE